jgi:hypothetical protein
MQATAWGQHVEVGDEVIQCFSKRCKSMVSKVPSHKAECRAGCRGDLEHPDDDTQPSGLDTRLVCHDGCKRPTEQLKMPVLACCTFSSRASGVLHLSEARREQMAGLIPRRRRTS